MDIAADSVAYSASGEALDKAVIFNRVSHYCWVYLQLFLRCLWSSFPNSNCFLHLQQVIFFAQAAGCAVFDDFGDVVDIINIAVIATSANVGGSGADVRRSGDNIVIIFGAVVGWYLLEVENIN